MRSIPVIVFFIFIGERRDLIAMHFAFRVFRFGRYRQRELEYGTGQLVIFFLVCPIADSELLIFRGDNV